MEEAPCARGRAPPHTVTRAARTPQNAVTDSLRERSQRRGIARARQAVRGAERRAQERIYRCRIEQARHGLCSVRPIVCMISLGYTRNEMLHRDLRRAIGPKQA
jgi:hypothetical protein